MDLDRQSQVQPPVRIHLGAVSSDRLRGEIIMHNDSPNCERAKFAFHQVSFISTPSRSWAGETSLTLIPAPSSGG